MFKKILKNYISFFIIFIVLSACEGRSCIEADDFGEYNTDIIKVDAIRGSCQWTDNNDYGSGSESIRLCLEKDRQNISISGLDCTIGNVGNCNNLKDCINNANSDECANNFNFTGSECEAKDGASKKILVSSAYNTCLEQCSDNCVSTFTEYEPSWEPTNEYNKNLNVGIEISSTNQISVQALGNISLRGSDNDTKTFPVNSKKVLSKSNNKNVNVMGGTPFSVSGEWCKTALNNSGKCPDSNNIVGETINNSPDGSNIQKRTEFLRRAILILDNFPVDGYLDSEGIYNGPLLQPDFNSWSCFFNVEDNAMFDSSFSCNLKLAGDIFDSQNLNLYSMQNDFVKNIGGSIIPTNLIEYITSNPFKDVICSTNDSNSNYSRTCNPIDIPGLDIRFKDANIPTVTLKNGYILHKNGQTVKMLYPSKLAFKILKNSLNDNETKMTGSCTAIVTVPNNEKIRNKKVVIKADNSWYFLTNSNSSVPDSIGSQVDDKTILNSNDYNTLEILKTGSEYAKLDDSKKYEVKIEFDPNENWTDEEGKQIPCGEGVAAFFIPQNEILVENSGFVSFKNLLVNSNSAMKSNCASYTQNANNSCIDSSYNLSFEIINPMYNFKDMNNDNIIEKNFYEYSKVNSVKKVLESEEQKITLNNNSGDWSDEIFVRKGQILRFDDSNWFNISQVSGNASSGYSIKNKIIPFNGFIKGIADGLVLKVEERPAVLCKSNAYEKVNNPTCNIKIDASGNKICSISFYQFCADNSNDDSKKRYCPTGCYGDFFVEGNNSTVCQFNKESGDQGVSLSTCQACKNFITNPTNLPKPEYDLDLLQCYDLGEYKGSVSNLTNTDDALGNEYSSINEKNTVEENGLLTINDIKLGAKKLSSVFSGSDYGSIDGLIIDETKKDVNTNKFTEFIYELNGGLQFSGPRNLKFLVIDNEDFKFNPNNYLNNAGNYTFLFSPQETFTNGQQLSLFIADKDWTSKDGFEAGVDKKFKTWIVKYGLNKNINEYGKLDPNSLYEFNSNGILIERFTKSEKIDMSKISGSISGIDKNQFFNLRIFFKIIDKEEKATCNNSTFKVDSTITKCRCKNLPNSSLESCETINPDKCSGSENIVIVEEAVCTDFYSNNSGRYNIQLKSTKEAVNSSGYIVKYVMEPILNILDGKTIALSTDNKGNFELCQPGDVTYKYGGTLPDWRANTVCTMSDPLVARYCRITKDETKNTGCLVGVQCLLPSINKDKMGSFCTLNNLENPNIASTDYPNYCFSVPDNRCNIYFDPYKENTDYQNFGETCQYGDKNCYRNCNTLDTNLYKSRCKFVNDSTGFVENFYQAVIRDTAYQIILKLCFTLMIMFYGLYYLLGMADLTHGELIRRVIKISFIYLMVGNQGWYYYNMFFVKFFKTGVDYLVFAIASAFDDSAGLSGAFLKSDFYDKSVLFSGVDKNLSLIFSAEVTYKIWGLMFVSFFGWLYLAIIYISIITYILTVANALLLYLTAQFFISILLSLGPIFFVLFVFEKTKGMFDKWITSLISFSLEQIFLLTCLSLFNMLVYNIIKLVLSYRVCWRPVWILNIPILGQIELMNWWKITTASSPSAAASAVPGLFQILLIYLIADIMKNFIEFMTQLGSGIGGGGVSATGLSSSISSAARKFYDTNVAGLAKQGAKGVGVLIAKKTIGYKTKEEEEKEEKSNTVLRDGLKKSNKEADQMVDQYKKVNGKELLGMSTKDRSDKLAEVRNNAFKESVENNSELNGELSKRKISVEDFAASSASKFTTSDSLVGLGANKTWFGFGNHSASLDKNEKLASNKDGKSDFSTESRLHGFAGSSDVSKVVEQEEEIKMEELKNNKKTLTPQEYLKREEEIKKESETDRAKLKDTEVKRQEFEKANKKAKSSNSSGLLKNVFNSSDNRALTLERKRELQQEYLQNNPGFTPAKTLDPLSLFSGNKPVFSAKALDKYNPKSKDFEGKTWKKLTKEEKTQAENQNDNDRNLWTERNHDYHNLGKTAKEQIKQEKSEEISPNLAKQGIADPFSKTKYENFGVDKGIKSAEDLPEYNPNSPDFKNKKWSDLDKKEKKEATSNFEKRKKSANKNLTKFLKTPEGKKDFEEKKSNNLKTFENDFAEKYQHQEKTNFGPHWIQDQELQGKNKIEPDTKEEMFQEFLSGKRDENGKIVEEKKPVLPYNPNNEDIPVKPTTDDNSPNNPKPILDLSSPDGKNENNPKNIPVKPTTDDNSPNNPKPILDLSSPDGKNENNPDDNKNT